MTEAIEVATKLILASASPRRKELLESVGLNFTVLVTNTDESRRVGESPKEYVERLAYDKAKAAQTYLLKETSQESSQKTAILAADTIVAQGDEVFGKPENKADAFRIWRELSDKHHQVMTAVCLLVGGGTQTRTSVTTVEFDTINEAQMTRYWDSAEPSDKAGAYAIQGLASAWVKVIHGSYSNVVGLPLKEVNELLVNVDLNWL